MSFTKTRTGWSAKTCKIGYWAQKRNRIVMMFQVGGQPSRSEQHDARDQLWRAVVTLSAAVEPSFQSRENSWRMHWTKTKQTKKEDDLISGNRAASLGERQREFRVWQKSKGRDDSWAVSLRGKLPTEGGRRHSFFLTWCKWPHETLYWDVIGSSSGKD